MIINLSPYAPLPQSSDALVVSKLGDVLTINNVVYDFSVIPDGATLPAGAVDCKYITGNVERIAGVLNLTLMMPTPPNATQAMNFPAPILNPLDGIIALPTDVPAEPLP